MQGIICQSTSGTLNRLSSRSALNTDLEDSDEGNRSKSIDDISWENTQSRGETKGYYYHHVTIRSISEDDEIRKL